MESSKCTTIISPFLEAECVLIASCRIRQDFPLESPHSWANGSLHCGEKLPIRLAACSLVCTVKQPLVPILDVVWPVLIVLPCSSFEAACWCQGCGKSNDLLKLTYFTRWVFWSCAAFPLSYSRLLSVIPAHREVLLNRQIIWRSGVEGTYCYLLLLFVTNLLLARVGLGHSFFKKCSNLFVHRLCHAKTKLVAAPGFRIAQWLL